MKRKKNTTVSYIVRLLCAVFIAVVALSVLPDQTIGQSDKNIKVAEAEKRIGAHIQYIEKRVGETVAAFYYEGAKKTLEDSFKKSGVTQSKQSLGYADSWGKMGIGLTWTQSAQEFYAYHLNVLTDSLRVIRNQGYAKESDLAYLDKGMEAWKQHEQEFPKQFQMLVDLYTKMALVYDEKNAYLEKYYATLDSLQKMKPYPSDRINALNTQYYRTTKAFDDRAQQIYDGEIQKVKDEIAKMAAKHLFSVINDDKGCANGAERVREDLKQTKKWVLAESIDFTKGSAAYLESDKKVLKTLTTAEEVIEKIGSIAREDEFPIMKIPMKYFKGIVKAGNEIVQAGGRLSAQEKKKLVDLAVKIDRVEVSVECAPVEVCEKGKWVRKGYKQIGEPTKKKLSPVVKEEQGVLVGELWQRIDKYTRSYAVLQERYEANPCEGVAQPPDQVHPTPIPKEDCDKFLKDIERLKEEKTAIETNDLPKSNRELEKAKKSLEEWNQGLDKHKEQLSGRILAAGKELKQAEVKLIRAKNRKMRLDERPNVPDANTWKENVKEAEQQLAKAQKGVEDAEKNLADAKNRRANVDKITAERKEAVRYYTEQSAGLVKKAASLQNDINRLRREHDECKRRNP